MIETTNEYAMLRSALDASINFSKADARGGMVETRFVQRVPERFIVYISSMLGCDKACRFCWLTQTGQTNATCLSAEEMLDQARTVLRSSGSAGASTVHFNFMARGEALSNPAVDKALFRSLAELAGSYGLASRIKISTILPTDTWTANPSDLYEDGCPPVDLYYSLYSLDDDWRRRWIPKAMKPDAAFLWLKRYQEVTGQRVVLHWALIDGENDDVAAAKAIASRVSGSGIVADFNLVRYNPANGKSREAEPDVVDSYLDDVAAAFLSVPRRVTPVGPDVMAGCGMFLTDVPGS